MRQTNSIRVSDECEKRLKEIDGNPDQAERLHLLVEYLIEILSALK